MNVILGYHAYSWMIFYEYICSCIQRASQSAISSFLGWTNLTSGLIQIPTLLRLGKYDIQAFQRRDDNSHRFIGSKFIKLEALEILINVKGHVFENMNFSMGILKLTAQQHTNASKSLKNVSDTELESPDIIPSRMVPENDIHSIELLYKTFHSKLQINEILQKRMIPQQYPKSYHQRIKYLGFPTPCRSSSQLSWIKTYKI